MRKIGGRGAACVSDGLRPDLCDAGQAPDVEAGMLANMGWPRWLAQRVALNGRGASGPAIRLRRLFPLPYVPYLFHDAALRIEMEERRMSVMIRG